jgi:DNA-binding transcriptional ArsR family regulator
VKTEVFEALADPIRARIVELLADDDLEAGSIASRFDVSRPAVSRHLRVLREAGVVSSRGEATKRVYSLRPESLVELISWTEKLRRRNEARLDALGMHLDKMAAEEEGKA